MITMQLEKLTRAEVQSNVVQLCSQYGTVKRIVVVPGGRPFYAIAGVEMSCPEEMLEVMSRFGDTRTAGTVIISIERIKNVP